MRLLFLNNLGGFIMLNKPYFSGFFSCDNPQDYSKNGIMLHKPPFGDPFWNRIAHLLSAEFADAETGKITDQFFGSCNDFDIWFCAKAARGDKFDVIIYEYDRRPDGSTFYDEAGAKMGYIGTEFGTTEQKEDGSWSLVEIEPIREICGIPFLYNNKLSFALRNSGREAEEAKLISKGVESGAVCA